MYEYLKERKMPKSVIKCLAKFIWTAYKENNELMINYLREQNQREVQSAFCYVRDRVSRKSAIRLARKLETSGVNF
jgi:flavin reductase (DIM6/NTAB) family NADH-FMN oxidoreductase RutF